MDADIPESVERPPPHLQVLCLVPVPEVAEIRLVPDIDDHAVDHVVGLDVADQMGEVAVPAGPVPVITGVGRSGILRSVSAPQIMDQEDEFRAVLARGPVVGERRGKSGSSCVRKRRLFHF